MKRLRRGDQCRIAGLREPASAVVDPNPDGLVRYGGGEDKVHIVVAIHIAGDHLNTGEPRLHTVDGEGNHPPRAGAQLYFNLMPKVASGQIRSRRENVGAPIAIEIGNGPTRTAEGLKRTRQDRRVRGGKAHGGEGENRQYPHIPVL